MDAREYEFIKKEILATTGVDLDFYKAPQMQRRLGSYLLRSGQQDWKKFFQMVHNDENARRDLKNYLTINVSSFFRDIDKYTYLERTILPELLGGKVTATKRPQSLREMRQASRTNGGANSAGTGLRIWSAGCSRGQEPYSLAMLLAEMTGLFTKHYILASDLDRSALAYAEAGGPYTKDDVGAVSEKYLKRYFERQGDKYFVKESLRRKIIFKQHNMLTDPFETGFDLIVCRNVVIYFTAEVKDRLYRRFYESLRPGGIMFVGGTEIISKASEIGFEPAGISFYRRRA